MTETYVLNVNDTTNSTIVELPSETDLYKIKTALKEHLSVSINLSDKGVNVELHWDKELIAGSYSNFVK